MGHHLVTDLPELEYSITWEEWKKRWEELMTSERPDSPAACSLLHSIFSVEHINDHGRRRERDVQRTIFLLELANGHRNSNRDRHSHVRDKAFSMLANNVFKNLPLTDETKYMDRSVQDKLIWFFIDEGNAEPTSWDVKRNVEWEDDKKTHHHTLASKYLREFCSYFWKQHWRDDTLKHRLLDLLDYHNALEVIVPDAWNFSGYKPCSHHRDWKRIDDGIIEKLKEFTLRDFPSIAAGVLYGSKAALLYLQLSIGLQQIANEAEQARLLEQKAAAEERLKKLQDS